MFRADIEFIRIRRGGMSAYMSSSQSIERCSPSAMVQWVELPSAFSLYMAFSTVASFVAGSRSVAFLSFVPSIAMACWLWRALALCQRWAQALAPCSEEMVGWALGLQWGWCRPRFPQSKAIHRTPAHTPQRRQSSLEDRPWTAVLVWRCSVQLDKTSKGSSPGSLSGWLKKAAGGQGRQDHP